MKRNRQSRPPAERQRMDAMAARDGDPENTLKKTCPGCGKEKHLYDFHRDRGRNDDPTALGRQTRCAKCHAKDVKRKEAAKVKQSSAVRRDTAHIRISEDRVEIELPPELEGRDIYFVTRRKVEV